MNYFENKNGIIAKLWVGYPGDYDWEFVLKIYDGNYIDKKFAKVQIYVDAERKMSVLQSNGYICSFKNLILANFY